MTLCPESDGDSRAPQKVASIRVDQDPYEAALGKARTEKSFTGGTFSSLFDLLLWDYLDRDRKFIKESDT